MKELLSMKKVMNQEVKMSQAKVNQILNDETSKSKKMVALFELGLEVKEIANILNVRYNFVYNVVSNYCNVNQIQTVTNKKEGKKEKIVALFEEGKSLKEISIELKTNYNYVFNVVKEYKKEKEAASE